MSPSSLAPIAIVGMACRLPGAVNPAEFWQLLCDGSDQISNLSPQRWSLVRSHLSTQEINQVRQSSPQCWGGFLEHVDQFDASFFGISPHEATIMTPQHRLLLEVAWEAMENAAFTPEQLAKTQTGVFIGLTNRDYSQLAWNADTLDDPHLTIGTNQSIAASRISYTLNLSGPCLVVDTACSSSLVAIHMACQSIRTGEATMAFAGGVNLILEPNVTFNLTSSGFQAADGRCKSFDRRADGYVRGEGVGVVLLKPLDQARADGDPIHGVILGSAVNHDGRTQGLTAPKPSAQEAVLRQAYKQAGVEPSQVQYVEAHGTGTRLGDPIELRALGKVIKEGRDAKNCCVVGTVKTNIGHLESAAGMAGLIKTVLSLQHRQIPPNLHFETPNPYIPFDKLPIEIPQTLMAWPNYGDTDLAGVSAFSFGGTNAHVVLQAAAPQPSNRVPRAARPLHLLVLSAKSEPALKAMASRFKTHLQTVLDEDLDAVCYTAGAGRSHYEYRLAVMGATVTELNDALDEFEGGRVNSSIVPGRLSKNAPPNVALLFTGQGSQYLGMGRQLYETEPIFRQALETCAEILQPELDRPLLDLIYPQGKATSYIDQTAYTQPVLFALEYALYQLWQSWGVRPNAVMGHSVGEYVAACVAGVFSLQDGLKLIAARGRLMQQLPAAGTMVSLMTTVERASAAIDGWDNVAIAAINGPQSTVISGPETALKAIVAQLELDGVKSKFLNVSHAFHSPLMQPMLADFETVARQIRYSPPQLSLISNITGQLATDTVATPEYWCDHILAPVNFATGMNILQQTCDIFLECGPKPTLLAMGQQCFPTNISAWLPSLRPGQDDWHQMLTSLGELYVRGLQIHWQDLYAQTRQKVALPPYPFQRQRYWCEFNTTPASEPGRDNLSIHSGKRHPILGYRLSPPAPLANAYVWDVVVDETYLTWLKDHQVWHTVIMPHTGYLQIALEATQAAFQEAWNKITNLKLYYPLFLSSQGDQRVQVVLTPKSANQCHLQIYSCRLTQTKSAEDWTLYADANVSKQQAMGGASPPKPFKEVSATVPARNGAAGRTTVVHGGK